MLRLGHEVHIDDPCASGNFDLGGYDCLFAMHATRSHGAIVASRDHSPAAPIVLCLTGTDLHLDLAGQRGATANQRATKSVSYADWIVLLEPEGIHQLPAQFHPKVVVIRQSATPIDQSALVQSALDQSGLKGSGTQNGAFTICVVGHLRDVKDPFLAARAARMLPAESDIVIDHYGAALDPVMQRQAEQAVSECPRYRWHGAVSHGEATRTLASSRLMVLSSKVEGAPSVISEAIVNDVPILATRIPATIGLLGNDYPGLFPVGDASALAQLMVRAEQDTGFLTELRSCIQALKPQFSIEAEQSLLRELLEQVGS